MGDRSNWNNKWDRRGRGGFRGSFGGRGGNFGGPGRRDRGFRGGYSHRGSYEGNRGFGDRDFSNWRKFKNEVPAKRLTEEEIAVTHYISDHKGFNGIIKSRYSDFQVSEINEDGEVAKLTSYAVPEPPVDKTVDEDEELLLNKYNLEILPMETWDSINKLVVSNEITNEKIEVDVTGMTKEQRTKIHDAVKKAFGDTIVGSTITIDDKKLVTFEKYRKGVRIDNRVKWIWPGEYVYFIVHKENCDTMEAAARIAERLRLNIKPSMLGYAGTKDRRGKTSQWFSLRKVDPRRIASACAGMGDVRVGNFSFKRRNLRLGMLRGNRFRLALRNVTADEAEVAKACTAIQEQGFVNYYGLQRFGSRRDLPTHSIGRSLLRGDFRAAIDAILQSQRRGEPRMQRALQQTPNDLVGALDKVSRNSRLLYVHSYQSLIWNQAVSERLKRSGAKAAEGDLVAAQLPAEDEFVEMESDGEEEPEEDGADREGKPDEPAADAHKKTKKEERSPPKEKVPTKVLTQEDVDSGRYSIFDIVLPLPGYNIEYPPNMKDYYEELLKKDDLTLELRHKVKSYSMCGAYRYAVVRPLDVQWRMAKYDDPYSDLLLSDVDDLQGRTSTGEKEDGKYKALLLTMSLPPSCYATMALRELLRVDTSCDNQALQNNYHKKKAESETDDGKRKLSESDDDGAKKMKQEDQ